jgi:polyphenol oxidase
MRMERFDRHPGVRVAFTGRAEGNQAAHTGLSPREVAASRAGLAATLGVGPERLSFMHQVHSALVAPAPAPGQAAPEADAIVDLSGALAPVVLTADCVPVAIAGELRGRSVLSVAHAGRPGLLGGVLEATLEELRAAGVTRLEAWIGPAVCGACYEVPEQMRAEAEERLPGISSRTSWGTPALDLPGAAARILAEAGALVHATHACTLEEAAWFSYRGGDTAPRNATLLWAGHDRSVQHAPQPGAERTKEEEQ